MTTLMPNLDPSTGDSLIEETRRLSDALAAEADSVGTLADRSRRALLRTVPDTVPEHVVDRCANVLQRHLAQASEALREAAHRMQSLSVHVDAVACDLREHGGRASLKTGL